MQELENFLNQLSDNDLEWWPFLFLRPDPEQPMDEGRVLALAALYGVFVGLLASLLAPGRVHVLTFPLCATAALYLVFRFTIAMAWNRRAERLRVRVRR